MGRLSDYCDIGSSKRIFAKQTTDSGIPFYRGAEITDLANKRFPSNQKYISKELYDDFSRKYYMPKINDILITAVGTIGSVWQVDTTEPFYYQDSISIILYNFKKTIDPKFLYYFLINESIQNYMKNSIINSVQKKLSIDFLRNMEIDLPSIEEQKERVRNLEIIDSLIMNNNLIITKLKENLATNYSYWFHQFDFPDENRNPYKSSGGKMVWNEELQREIPQGWEVSTFSNSIISELIDVGIDKFAGEKQYFSTSEIVDDNYTFVKKVTYDKRESRANMQPIKESIWFAKMKNSIKHIAFVDDSYLLDKVVLSTGYMGIKAKSNSFTYIYCFVSDPSFEKFKDIIASGSTQESITNTTLSYVKMLVPNQDVLISFETKFKPTLKLIYKLKEQNDSFMNYKSFLLSFILTGFPK